MVLDQMDLWKRPRRSEKKVDISIKDLDENQRRKTFCAAYLKNLVKLEYPAKLIRK